MEQEIHLKRSRLCLKRKSNKNNSSVQSNNSHSKSIEICNDDENNTKPDKQLCQLTNCPFCETNMIDWSEQRKNLHKTACSIKNNPNILSRKTSKTDIKNSKDTSDEKPKKKTKREPTLKTIVNKALDEELQTALALSKSLVDEDKRQRTEKKRSRNDPLPLQLTIEPEKRQMILAERLTRYILTENCQDQSPVSILSLKSTSSEKISGHRNWWNLSAYNPNTDSIQGEEKSLDVFYVQCLNPPVVPTSIKEGDKVFSLSQVPGRESLKHKSAQQCSQSSTDFIQNENLPLTQGFLLDDSEQPPVNEFEPDMKRHRLESTDQDVVQDELKMSLPMSTMGINTISVELTDQSSQTNASIENMASLSSCGSCSSFQSMVNNPSCSDLHFVLDSGEKLFAHKFVFAAKQLQPDGFMINSSLVSEVKLQGHRKQDVLLVLHNLYGGDPPPSREHINRILKRFQLVSPSIRPKSTNLLNVSPTVVGPFVSTPVPQSKQANLSSSSHSYKKPVSSPCPSDTDMFEDYEQTSIPVEDSDAQSVQNPVVDENASWCNDTLKEEDLVDIDPGNWAATDKQSPVLGSASSDVVVKYCGRSLDDNLFQDSFVLTTQLENCVHPGTQITKDEAMKFIDLTQDDTIEDESGSDKQKSDLSDSCSLRRERSFSSFLSPETLTPKKFSLAKTDSPIGVLATPPKTFVKDPSTWTPMPDYLSMVTPELKKTLSNFGVRPLPKKKAFVLLKEIYRYTHEGDNKNHLSQPSLKKASGSYSGDLSNVSSSDEHDSEGPMEELLLLSEEESGATASQITQKGDFKDALRQFIRSDPDLYRRILSYEPVDLKDLHTRVKSANIKISMKKFMDFLDEECITFRFSNRRRHKPKSKTVKRKSLTQS